MLPIIQPTQPSVRRRRERAFRRFIDGLIAVIALMFITAIMALTFTGVAVCKPNESIVQCLKN